jgi:hypothetical protein
VLELALAGDGEDVVLELNIDVAVRQSRQVSAKQAPICGLDEIHGRKPAPGHPVAPGSLLGLRRRASLPMRP